MRFVFAISMWLAASIGFAQPIAKIIGPTQVPAGELTALSSTGSVGDNLLWIRPDGLAAIQAGCELMDQQIFFATTREGVYEFILVVADKEASIAYAKHTVTVGKPTTPPPPPIDPPPVDPPPTPGKWADLIGVSKAAADAVSDSPTRQELKTAVSNRLDDISEKCKASQCPTIQAAQQQISATIDSVLLSRPNRFSKWAAWRKSISDVLRAKGVTDLQDYLASVKAFLAGL